MNPNYGAPGFWHVVDTGDLLDFPFKSVKMQHVPMHLYTAEELKLLFKGCEVLEIVSSNVTLPQSSNVADEIAAESRAWSTIVELERKLNANPGLFK